MVSGVCRRICVSALWQKCWHAVQRWPQIHTNSRQRVRHILLARFCLWNWSLGMNSSSFGDNLFFSFHRYLMSEPGQTRFHGIRESHLKPDVNDALKTFRELKKELKVNGYFEAETPFNRSKLPPYLYTWFQTNEAMIMLLSNQTVQVCLTVFVSLSTSIWIWNCREKYRNFPQVNFVKSHKKMLICPKTETVTLADGKITRANFKTVSLTALAMHRCSTQNLDMLKYVTASLKFLSSKLSDWAGSIKSSDEFEAFFWIFFFNLFTF